MRQVLSAALAAAILVSPGAATAQTADLVQEMRRIAQNISAPLPQGLASLSYGEALRLADQVGLPAVRQHLRAHYLNQRALPSLVLDAFRFKQPNLFGDRRTRG